MPRRSAGRPGGRSGGGGGFFGGSQFRKQSTTSPAPVPVNNHPPTTTGGGGGLASGIVGNVVGGMASGVGFGVAQRAVDGIMGPRQMEVRHTNDNSAPFSSSAEESNRLNTAGTDTRCSLESQELKACITQNSDISLCQNLMERLKTCQASYF